MNRWTYCERLYKNISFFTFSTMKLDTFSVRVNFGVFLNEGINCESSYVLFSFFVFRQWLWAVSDTLFARDIFVSFLIFLSPLFGCLFVLLLWCSLGCEISWCTEDKLSRQNSQQKVWGTQIWTNYKTPIFHRKRLYLKFKYFFAFCDCSFRLIVSHLSIIAHDTSSGVPFSP